MYQKKYSLYSCHGQKHCRIVVEKLNQGKAIVPAFGLALFCPKDWLFTIYVILLKVLHNLEKNLAIKIVSVGRDGEGNVVDVAESLYPVDRNEFTLEVQL